MMLFFKSPHGPFGDWDPTLVGAIKPRNIKFPDAATLANAEREPDIVKKSLGWRIGRLESA